MKNTNAASENNARTEERSKGWVSVLIVFLIVAAIVVAFVARFKKEQHQEEEVTQAVETLKEEVSSYKFTRRPVTHNADGTLSVDGIGNIGKEPADEPAWVERLYAPFKEDNVSIELSNKVAALVRTKDISDKIKREIWGVGVAFYDDYSKYSPQQLVILQDCMYGLVMDAFEGT